MGDSEYTRQRIWSGKDNLPRELQFLQPLSASDPQFARVMVSPRQTIVAADSTDQTLAISAAMVLTYHANSFGSTLWSAPPSNAAVLFEMLRAQIVARDTTAHIQLVAPAVLVASNNNVAEPAPVVAPLPFTFPAVTGSSWNWHAKIPTAPFLQTDGPSTNGPLAQIGIINTSSTATALYRRAIAYFFRYVYDIDFTKERVYVTGTII